VRALTTEPRRADSTRIEEIAEPAAAGGDVLVRTLAVGVCGTDREIIAGQYGAAPAGRPRLVLGHEAVGEVIEAPPHSGLVAGGRVVPIVRIPDDPSCASCAAGEWDLCLDGRYTEHGILGRDGFAAERFRAPARFLVPVDRALGLRAVLVEPASVVAKAWEHIMRIGGRAAAWAPRTVLITGAGPVGLLAALLGVQLGLEVTVFDRATEGAKPALVRRLGAAYHNGDLAALGVVPQIVVECTGAPAVIRDILGRTGPLGVVCLTGISSGGRSIGVDLGAVNRTIVLENDAVFGSVNANRRHYEAAARALAAADPAWLDALITHRRPLDDWPGALRKGPDHVKTILELGE
jgi:glucose 1-dehydrogenase